MHLDWKEVSNYLKILPKNFDYLLILQIIPLLIISSILIKEINPALFTKQMIYYTVGAMAFLIAVFIPWERILWWFAPLSYLLNLLLLLAVDVAGKSILGARRWLPIPGTGMTVQPSEFIKISVLLMLAYLIYRNPPPKEGYGFKDFLKLSVIIIIPFLLIAKEPDLGTAMVLLLTGYGVLFLVGVRWRVWFTVLLLTALAAPVLYNHLHDYQKKRISDFLGKPSYHVRQALIAIGSGGLEGKPKEEATQTQLKFLPISSSDFIFAYLGERFGFKGMLTVITLYILLIVHLLYLSRIYEQNYLIKTVAGGIAFLIFIYMGVNIAMIIGMAPVVGVPLPMFSHGGTSFIIFAVLFGILINLIAFRRYFQYNADAKITMMGKGELQQPSPNLPRPIRERRRRKEGTSPSEGL
ncbi:FtsW/RodA/SpoVE family cell cycle protein [Nitratifractor salsuginis]|uniref:Cell cycle protein n=1 Tax=Nitratifractor salsuginis (strain DSM 16511 / JCM 12458 / E9I37-1) TaxID=749222 RepID=E6X341_NITSE|nr:FtsW/RodA/SpoVE family cell cycle protein [Nitratifractor salsuginis]ADV46185.1 cell cycle protein [Nitratifractor salsuginis DSM 16511]